MVSTTSGNEVVNQERRRVAVLGSKEFAVRCGVGEGDLVLGQMAAEHEGAPENTNQMNGQNAAYWRSNAQNTNFPRMIDKKRLPDGVQHAGGDSPPPGQAEHPDSADPTESRLRDGGAAPGSVSLHEIVLCHVFLTIWLLQDSVTLKT